MDKYLAYCRAKEAEVERGLQQPACGCRAAWEYIYANDDTFPRVVLTEIRPCPFHRDHPTLRNSVESQANQMVATIRQRIQEMRGKAAVPA